MRLLEAIARAGATPHILVPHRLLPADEPQARAEAKLRGWPLEDVRYPAKTILTRVRQHVRREASFHSSLLVNRLQKLSRGAVFTQFEEIGVMQYVLDAPPHIPAVVSPHNVDSAVAAHAASALSGRVARGRATYRARRLLATERRAARRADHFICVTSHDRDYFIRTGARRGRDPNRVDDDLFALPEEPVSRPRVLFFGSYLWQPNAGGLARHVRDVWPRVVGQLPRAELRIAGPGPAEAIRDAASQTCQATILGFVPDLLAGLGAARVVVAPIPFGGGTRIKVLEATAAARPVVGTTVAVERIGFEHQRHGLIADDPEAMVAATLRVLTDTEGALRYARNARILAEGYRWEAMTAPLEGLVRDFVERRWSIATRTRTAGSSARAY